MKHSTYFDGKVQSLELFASGTRATVGVIEPGDYTFPTSSEEHITILEGSLQVKVPGKEWQTIGKGKQVIVPRGVSFDIKAAADVAYICYYR